MLPTRTTAGPRDVVSLPGASGCPPSGVAPASPEDEPAGRRGVAFVLFLLTVLTATTAVVSFMAGGHLADRAHAGRITYQRLTVRRGSILSARFAPDGETVLYSAAWDGGPPEVFEAEPGVAPSRSLGLPETLLLAVSPSGTMAVMSGARQPFGPAGTLVEIPMSGGTLRSVMDKVWAADWSADGATLAVVHEVDGKSRVEMPPGTVLCQTSDAVGAVRVSPSGRYLAMVGWPISGDIRGSVVIIDASGEVHARSQLWNEVVDLAWTPDGGEVWFGATSERAGYGLRALAPDGRERVVERLPIGAAVRDINREGEVLLERSFHQTGIRGRAPGDERERELGWLDYGLPTAISADGRALLFDERGLGGGLLHAICLRGMDGSPPVRLGEGHGCDLSPDGRWALVVHGPPSRLMLLPTGAGEPVTLRAAEVMRYYDARFLPNGKAIVFSGAERRHAPRTFIQDLDGGLPDPITPEGTAGAQVSPDGRWIVAYEGHTQSWWTYPVRGGEGRSVAGIAPGEMVFSWTADGRGLLVGRQGGNLAVDRLDPTTGARTPWRTFSLPDPAGAMMVNLVLTPDGRSYAYGYIRSLSDLYLVDGLK